MKRIELGQITAPVGIKGEIRVYPYLEQTRISDIKKVLVENGAEFAVEKTRPDGKGLMVIKLAGINDRNAAESLRGRKLILPEGQSLDLGENTYLVQDLVGAVVVSEDGSPVGKLKEVHSRTAQDIYEIETEAGKSFLLPAVSAFILSVDTDAGLITVRLPEGITEL